MNEPGAKIWSAIRNHYAEGWLLFGLTWCPIFAWFTPTALPAMLFIWGIPFLVYFGRIKRFWPAAAMTAAMLVLGFLRSDFVTYLVEGKGFAAAWATKYWFAPIITWTVAWAVVLGFDALPERQAPRVAAWFGWLVIALACVQLIESISQVIGHTGALRTALNNAFYDGARPEMLIVGMANCNCILTMLFWPLCFFYVDRRQFAPAGFLAAVVLIGAVASDTNAHLLAMAASTAVFFAVRYWPRALNRVAPWRALAGLTAGAVVLFPVAIWFLTATGLGSRIKTDILPSWAARIDIWTFTFQRSLEKPWFGWGYEASRLFDPIIPNHPHNMSLQAWLEMGVPGLLLLAAMWAIIFWQVGPKEGYRVAVETQGMRELDAAPDAEQALTVHQRALPYILALGTAYYVVNTISFGLWRAWYYSLGALVVGVTILVIKAVDTQMKLRTQQ